MRPTTMRPFFAGTFGRNISWQPLLLLVLSIFSGTSVADTLDLSSYRGKLVLVDFWASWCAPCRKSLPWLNEMQTRYGHRGLVVIGVNVDSSREAVDRFLKEVPAQFAIVYDPAGAIAAQYEVPGMPTSFLYGPNGELIEHHVGFKQADLLRREAKLKLLLPAATEPNERQ
ncbi:MAG: TlpA disulfide reductase family protein [Steroidobacter sp.]